MVNWWTGMGKGVAEMAAFTHFPKYALPPLNGLLFFGCFATQKHRPLKAALQTRAT